MMLPSPSDVQTAAAAIARLGQQWGDTALLSTPPALWTTMLVALLAWRFRPDDGPRREPGSVPDGRSSRVPPVEAQTGPVRSLRRGPHIGIDGLSRGRRRSNSGLRRWGGLIRSQTVGADDAAQWCDAIARTVRGGASLSSAIAVADRPRSVAAAIGTSLSERPNLIGPDSSNDVTLESRLQRLGARPELSPDLRLVLSLLATVARLGGPAAQPIDRAGAILRARAAARAEVASQSAQAKMSALVMTLLPVAMLLVMLLTSVAVRDAVTTRVGVVVVVAGAVFNVTGWWWMRRIIAGGER